MVSFDLRLYRQDDYFVRAKSETQTFSGATREDAFKEIFKANAHLEKIAFQKGSSSNAVASYRFKDEDWQIQDEYAAWCNNCDELVLADIYAKA